MRIIGTRMKMSMVIGIRVSTSHYHGKIKYIYRYIYMGIMMIIIMIIIKIEK